MFIKDQIELKKQKIKEQEEAMMKVRVSRGEKFRQFDKSFASFNENDMRVYLELYDKNMDEQFEPSSSTLISAGCTMLFCNWLMVNGGSSFTIQPISD